MNTSKLLQPAQDGEAEVGERVTVLDLETTSVVDYRLVDGKTADATKEEISIESPLGSALLGRHVSDVITLESEERPISLEVVEIDG